MFHFVIPWKRYKTIETEHLAKKGYSFQHQPHKMVKHTQKSRRRIAWVCLTILWGCRLKG